MNVNYFCHLSYLLYGLNGLDYYTIEVVLLIDLYYNKRNNYVGIESYHPIFYDNLIEFCKSIECHGEKVR